MADTSGGLRGRPPNFGDEYKTFSYSCQGGLVLNHDPLFLEPGYAIELLNYEPSIYGGYRKLSGFSKFNDNQPNSSNKIRGAFIHNGQVVAVSGSGGTMKHASTGAGAWTACTGAAVTAPGTARVNFVRYKFGANEAVIYVVGDGTTEPRMIDSTFAITQLNATGYPAGPKYVAEFQRHIFYAGHSTGTKILFTAPLDETTYDAADGAGEINIGENIVGIKVFRDALYVFCLNSVWKLTGTGLDDFEIEPVTRNIGCISGYSVQEIGGSLVFLSPDGIRPIAGTARIGDIELETLSRNVHPLIADVLAISDPANDIVSTVIRGKNQYRIFYPEASSDAANCGGILGAIIQRPGVSPNQESMSWEWSRLLGIKPSCSDSYFIGTAETIIHGGYDGYVYQQESGSSFDGADIPYNYTSTFMALDDPANRKIIHRVNTYLRREGALDITCNVLYDYESGSVLQPPPFQVTDTVGVSTYGTAVFDSGYLYTGVAQSVVVNNAHGSGLVVGLRYSGADQNPPHIIQSVLMQYILAGRR